MLRIANISLPLGAKDEVALNLALAKIHAKATDVKHFIISRKSVDARKKDNVTFVVSVDIDFGSAEQQVFERAKQGTVNIVPITPPMSIPKLSKQPLHPPVVIGFGPGGLFAALYLARMGVCPIVLERGESVEERQKTYHSFMQTRTLNKDSNVQFGEGGAGTFSDGKLTTGIKSPRCKTVLEELVAHGAPEDLLYLARPHIGTDNLPTVVKNIREEILQLGGKILFNSRLTDIHIENGKVTGLEYLSHNKPATLLCDKVFLAIGHSARDTQEMLYHKGVQMIQKPFSVGFRIEHKQTAVNLSQYGKFAKSSHLPPAEYHLATRFSDNTGAYTFCMCPGGTVVNASSEENGVCVNGMSNYFRDGVNANAALLVDVRPQDFDDESPMAGFHFAREIEQKAFTLAGGNYNAPAQLVKDFLLGRPSTSLGSVQPSFQPGITLTDFSALFKERYLNRLREGIKMLEHKMHGFSQPDAILTAPETRSSCPIRIVRDETMQANIKGLYPIGEGAGYAGGIMSAAVDGLKCAQIAMED